MRIERLRIENFRRFRLVDIELADGVTALVGRNGAGKSTLLEAIGWCLYGNDAARTGKDLLKRRGAAPQEDVRVHLAFRFGPHVYEVTRELLGRSESHAATVKVDGKVLVAAGAASGKEATAYVERLFHLDRDAFFTTLVARQRELAALTSAKPAERKRLLIGLLRLDAVDAAIVEARAQRRDARAQLVGLRSAMLDPLALRQQVEAARKMVEAHTLALAAADAGIAQLVETVEDVRARRDAGRKLAEEHKRLAHEVQGIDERLVFARVEQERRAGELQRARAAAAEAALLAPRVEALPAARARVEQLSARALQHAELARLRAELARTDAEALAAARELEAARAALAPVTALRAEALALAQARPEREAALLAAQKKASEMDARAREVAKQLNEVGAKEKRVRALGPEAPCPTCTRPLREHFDPLLHGFHEEAEALRRALEDPAREAARREEAAAREALAAHAAREAAARAQLDRLAAEEARAATSAARLADAQARAARLREQEAVLAGPPFDPAELEAARAEARALEAARERHVRLLAEAEREASLVALLAEIATTQEAAAKRRAELAHAQAALAFDPAAHEATERAAEQAERRLTEARIARERAVGERVRAEDVARRAAEALAQQEALAARAAELEARVRLLEELAGDRDAGLLPEFKDHLISRIRPLLSLHAGRLFRELTDGRYADLEVDEDYDLLVHDEGEAFALARFSGGESDLANLCLRLAVSRVVAERAGTDGFGFLALDEIFGSQDDGRKANILRALASLSSQFRQILLITHIADVKESADHVLRVEALEDGTSRVVLET